MSSNRLLESAAKAMIEAADKGRSAAAVLKQLCPRIYTQITKDARNPLALSLWGRCVNVDENAGQTIVHPAILQAIGKLAGVPMDRQSVHAGLQHTYGYLFSLIETPFGFKRDRWTTHYLERGFGIEKSLLGEAPREGTLLANATWFLGQIVFRRRPRLLLRLSAMSASVARELVDYDFALLTYARIVERVVLPGSNAREVSLLTDLVPFPHSTPDPTRANTLLIYSIMSGTGQRIRLVTAFPVMAGAASELRNAVSTRQVDVRLRYNAYVHGLFGRTLKGERFQAPAIP